MGVTIKYRGLADAPVLVTGQGRHPALAERPAGQLVQGQLFVAQGGPELGMAIRRQEQERVLSEVRRRVDGLAGAMDRLSLPAADLLAAARGVLISQPQALSLSADQEATLPAIHTLEARWPSSPGVNLSTPQNPAAAVGLADGTHTFTLTVDGDEHQIAVDVVNGSVPENLSLLGSLAQPATDTQEELLGRVARAIEGADSRIKAGLEYYYRDQSAGGQGASLLTRTVRLRVEGAEAGAGPQFSLADVSGSIVGAYGLDRQSPPRPARLLQEGALRDQPGDELSLDDGHLAGSLEAATVGPAQVQVKPGLQSALEELGGVMARYNDLVSYLDTHADLLRPSLKDRVTRPLEDRARALTALGLRATPQGRLEPTSDFGMKLQGDLASVRKTLWGGEGWLTALRGKLGQIQEMPPQEFALSLEPGSYLDQSRRAWEALGMVAQGIVGGYY